MLSVLTADVEGVDQRESVYVDRSIVGGVDQVVALLVGVWDYV